jgi:hypothetical protein
MSSLPINIEIEVPPIVNSAGKNAYEKYKGDGQGTNYNG